MSQASIPEFLERFLRYGLRLQVLAVAPASGGMIAKSARLDCRSLEGARSDETLFAKWSDAPRAREMFDSQARGLWALEAALKDEGLVRVPRVRWVGENFLLLEHIEAGPTGDEGAARLGQGLARMHLCATPTSFGVPVYGWDRDTFLGEWRQPNAARGQWADFLRDARLLPQLKWAKERELMFRERSDPLREVAYNLPKYLQGLEASPSLLHGDLWSGNFLIDQDGTPFVFDPAVYFGEREMEIALCELFGGFPPAFYRAYREEWPLQDGYEQRRPVYQVFHLLNHLNHFGEQYGPALDAKLAEVLSQE
jgi:protein-ribulosamine 3-kinase